MSPITIYFTNEQVPNTSSYRTICVDHNTQQLNEGNQFPVCPVCRNPVGWVQV